LVFLSSPADAEASICSILRSNIPVLAILGVLSFVCFRFAGKETRSKLATLVLFLSIIVVLYHYILPCDYGELDKAVLGLEKKLDNKSIFPWIADIAVIISAMLLAKICIRKYLVQMTREKEIGSLLISADLNEILEVSDRLLVMKEGKIVAAFPKANVVDVDELGEYMLGIKTMTAEEMEGLL
jgi:hypothetical protein